MSKYLTTSWVKRIKSAVQINVPETSCYSLKQNLERVAFSKLADDTKAANDKSTSEPFKLSSISRISNPLENCHDSGTWNDGTVAEVEVATKLANEKNKISAWQAGFNVTNAIQGMSMVSLPYTVLEGGYVALLSMIVVAQVCCYTGDVLIDCLYEDGIECRGETRRKRIRGSYVSIAEEVLGKKIGGQIVYLAQLIELMMTCILYVLLSGELLSGIFPSVRLSLTHWIAISTLPLLPCAVLKNMKHVAWLSFWCTISHAVSNGIVFVYCLIMASDWRLDLIRFRIDFHTLPISIGIVVFSYTSQIFLPSIEGSMREKEKFKRMMFWSHFTAAILKVAFAFIGFVTFGSETQEVITNNLPTPSLKVVVNIFLVSKALLSFPLPYFATIELLETTFFTGKYFPPCYSNSSGVAKKSLKTWGYLMRISLICLMPILASSIPHFAILLAMIGSFTGNMLSLVWPAYFHYVLRRHSLSAARKVLDITIIVLGLFFSVVGIFFNARALQSAIKGLPIKPFQGYL